MICDPTKLARCACWLPADGECDRFTKAQGQWIRSASTKYTVCVNQIVRWVRRWRCQICDADIAAPNQACLDHDHHTGRPRGVVCRNCNIGLGFLDRALWLDKAAAYLNGRDVVTAPLAAERNYHPNAVHLPAPVVRRPCLARTTTVTSCGKDSLPFLLDDQRCRTHSSPEQRKLNRERELQWRTLAEGLFWSAQALWAALTGGEDVA